MKRWLKIGGIVCGTGVVLVILFVLSGYLLPSEVTIETSMDIDAPPEKVFAYFDTQEGIEAWWKAVFEGFEKDAPDMPPMEVRAMPGPKAGAGTKIDFLVEGEVAEHWTIRESTPNEVVVYDVDFMVFQSVRTITLEPVDADTTRVGWSDTSELSNPLMRWMPVIMGEETVVENFNGALGTVKRIAENP